jgi:hypothetical protein
MKLPLTFKLTYWDPRLISLSIIYTLELKAATSKVLSNPKRNTSLKACEKSST